MSPDREPRIDVADLKRQVDAEAFYRAELPDLKSPRNGRWADGGRCPFHEDRHRGSFYVNFQTGGFYCHACGARGGDPIDFLTRRDGLSFAQALATLNDRWGRVAPAPTAANRSHATDLAPAPAAAAANPHHDTSFAPAGRPAVSDAEAHARAAARAAQIWNRAGPADPRHPYLARKRIGAYGIRQVGGVLLVPLRDAAGTLHSLESIDGAGRKKFLPGGRVKSHFHAIGALTADAPALWLAEGYATGASLHEAEGGPVVVAFSATNLLPVARALRERFPGAVLKFCADDDPTPGNPGLTAARGAAAAVGRAEVFLPDWGEQRPPGAKDFNDRALAWAS